MTSNHSTMGTPTRNATSINNNSNYAEPHTPIASAKRPRNPTQRSSATKLSSTCETEENVSRLGNTSHTNSPRRKLEQDTEKTPTGSYDVENTMSPMHPPRKVPSASHGSYSKINSPTEDLRQEEAEEVTLNEDENSSSSSWGALFSPVLSFLNGNNNSEGKSLEDDVLTEDTVDDEGDVHMNTNSCTPTNSDACCSLQTKFDDHATTTAKETTENNNNNEAEVASPDQQYHQYNNRAQENNEEVEEEEEEEEEEFNPYFFIKTLPDYRYVVPDPHGKICLPPKDISDPPITLVLDLDETLVHCTVEPVPNADMVFPVVFHGIEYKVHVRCRPFLTEFLEAIHKKFEVVVFTASQQVYADELLNRIDPEGKYIKYRMFRESCLLVQGNYLKDLNVLGRNLKKAVLVDNSPHAFGYQVDNGIPIESWFDDPRDTELVKLEQFLQTLHGANDVTTLVRAKFQTYKLIRDA